MNILLSSVGRRVQLVDYFKEALNKVNGKVIAVDCDPTAPALYHADSHEIIPRIYHPDYFDTIKEICKRHEVSGVLSLIDPELTLLSAYQADFAKEQITLIMPSQDVIDICFDKYATYSFLLEHDLPAVPTYINGRKIEEALHHGSLQFPLIVKPRCGSASIGVHKVSTMKELKPFLDDGKSIVQPFMEASEYCVEAYVDLLTNDITDMFCKRKYNMRAGETDKSVSVNDGELTYLSEKLINALKPNGPVDVDLFKVNGRYLISEINPRFGGGYPYAHEMGHNFIEKIMTNLTGKQNPPYEKYTGKYTEGKSMVRYDKFVVL
ncbi:carbamoyl-phosphate synthase large subunit [Evansella caseinilytica]|uniref:Carbamoyl-phosphate synthase large subunit n=1 Tax=Evansella caseinilytica TaxID=1503961 RepID=A0A1H3ULU4_9BACI|nr:ATP-grasp domain-containing protein [Evansella caseinilytica]SDZ63338.1 carbamoyl-phosphate synthase large subunit [Evansella caseinilytica]